MEGQKENIVLSQCLKYLEVLQIYHWRNNTGALKIGRRFIRFGFPGSSDILGILPDGRFLAIECKREKGGRLSEAQKDFISRINANGGVAMCVHSLDELQENMRKIL
jgi:hypothetical protein